MSAPNIPKCCFNISIPPTCDNSEDLEVSKKSLTPLDAKVSPFVLSLLESIARDYVFSEREHLKGEIKARLSMSLKNGIQFNSCSDPKIVEICKEPQGNAVTKEDAEKYGLTHLKRAEPTAEMIKDANRHFQGREVIFIDPWAYQLFQNEVNDPLQIDLEVPKVFRIDLAAGQTTSPLRFPHLLKDLNMRYKRGREDPNLKICIAGPGLNEHKGFLPTSPQFVEIFSLFPNAQFLLLDNDKHAIEVLKQQFNTFKIASYDPCMLRLRTTDSSSYLSKKEYQKVFSIMKENLASRAKKPPNAGDMLAGKGPFTSLVVNIADNKIEVRDFDINTAQFKDEDKFDVIVATLSIINALNHQLETSKFCNPYPVLKKFINSLRERGSLYIDVKLFESFIAPHRDLIIKCLEGSIGNRLRIEEIPLSDFQPTAGISGTITSIRIPILDNNLKGPTDISTHDLIAIIRTSEKVDMKKEELAALEEKIFPFELVDGKSE